MDDDQLCDDYDEDDYQLDDGYREDDYQPPPEPYARLRRYTRKAAPALPYLFLAIGIKTRSTPWLLVALFTVTAVKPGQRYITVHNCTFTDTSTGLLVK